MVLLTMRTTQSSNTPTHDENHHHHHHHHLDPKSFVDVPVRCATTMNDTQRDRVVHHVTHNLEFTRDGSRLLSTTSNDILRTYDVPAKMMVGPSKEEEEEEEEEQKEDGCDETSNKQSSSPSSTTSSPLKCRLEMTLPKAHYDACWYPGCHGNAQQETTMLALCASKESGLKIFDTRDRDDDEEKRNEFGGVVPHSRRERCTYSTKNRNDELVPSISCAFSGNGGKVLGGRREERGVCVWDTNRPGHECQKVGFKTQSKLTSCFATGNEYNGFIENSDGNIFAAGSYEGGNSICVYDLRDGFNGSDCCVMSIANPHRNEKTGKMGGGVTRLKFSACGKALFSSARKSNSILCWDLRANIDGSMMTNIQRPNMRSNAKTKFDIEPCGKHLVAGGDDGILRCFDLDQKGKEVFAWKAPPKDESVLVAAFTFHPLASSLKERVSEGNSADNDDENLIMNDVALGASASGERLYHPSTGRKFMSNSSSSSSSSSNSSSSSSESSSSESLSRREVRTTTKKEPSDGSQRNVLSIWGWTREKLCVVV